MHTHLFTGAGFCTRLAARAALLLITLSLAPTAQATPITVIASFNVTNGRQPRGGVTFDAAGNMYGTTYRGGSQTGSANAGGVVWEIAHGTNAITDLALFTGYGADPGSLYGDVAVDANGNVYGTAYSGGTTSGSVYGEVFEVVAGSGVHTDLGDLGVGANPGTQPMAGVTRDAAGDLFGTTEYGSTNASGTIWEIPAGGTLTTLASFLGTPPNGSVPQAGVTLDSQGNLYGTCRQGGVSKFDGSGTVWELPRGSNTVVTLAQFTKNDGYNPYPVGDVTVDAAGNVYGTAPYGGPANAGFVWEVVAGTNTITVLGIFAGHLATNTVDGYTPSGNVVLDGAGNLFGTTTGGGTGDFGTVWEIPAGGTLTTIASFAGTNGANPYGNVSLDAQGNLFGTASTGGPADAGVVWEMVGVGVGGGTAVPTGLTLTPNPAPADTTINATVTFSQSVPAGTSVAITRNGTALGSVITPAAETSLAFTLSLPGYLNGSYTIGATLNGQTANQALTVTGDPNKPVPISIIFSPNPVKPNTLTTATLTLSAAAPAGGVTAYLYLNGAYLDSVVVAAGATSGTFNQTLVAGTYAYAAVENGVQVTATLTVTAVQAAPGAPFGLQATAQSAVVNLSWQLADANAADVFVERQLGTGAFTQIADLTGDSTTYQDSGLAPGAYTYRVRTANAAGNSPYSNTATATPTVPPASTHILWGNTSGAASIWNYSVAAGTYTHQEYGPYTGYTAKAVADGGTDGKTRVLWNNANGSMSLWSLDNTAASYTHTEFGPYAGYTASALSVGTDNTTHVLWVNTNGSASIWNYSTASSTFTHQEYGPYTGYTPKTIADGPDGKLRVLWNKSDGSASIWSLNNSTGAFAHAEFGPFGGWTASTLSVGTDNTTHVLWTNTNGAASIWNYSTASSTFTHKEYGPYTGYSAQAIADGSSDGKTRVLWDKTDGTLSVWGLDNAAAAFAHADFGPFGGWTATGVSAP